MTWEAASVKGYQTAKRCKEIHGKRKPPSSCERCERFTAHALIAMFRMTRDMMKAVKPMPTVKVNMASSS